MQSKLQLRLSGMSPPLPPLPRPYGCYASKSKHGFLQTGSIIFPPPLSQVGTAYVACNFLPLSRSMFPPCGQYVLALSSHGKLQCPGQHARADQAVIRLLKIYDAFCLADNGSKLRRVTNKIAPFKSQTKDERWGRIQSESFKNA